jgi:hypothetical protein
MDNEDRNSQRLQSVPAVIGTMIGVLLISLLPWGTGFYTLVRLLVTAGAVWVIFGGRTYQLSPPATIALAVIALIYNPLIPVYADRGLWIALDLVGAGGLGWVWLQLRDHINPLT